MQVRILGPFEVVQDGRLVALGSRRQRQLLALLVLADGAVVSLDRLAEDLWSGQPPATARHTLQVYAHRIRRALGADAERLVTVAPGYRLRLGPDEVDAEMADRLASEGRNALAAGDAERAADHFDAALALWRGPLLADLGDLPAFEADRTRWDATRLAVVEDRIEADLARGGHGEVVAELERLTAQHPFRERLWAQLMLALYRSGRQADALDAFQRARRILADELGIEPGPRLAELRDGILLQDTALELGPHGKHAPRVALPLARTRFFGRRRELSRLAGWLRTRRLVTITGPPGVGKTRLALQAARGAVDHHPHGVYFVALADLEEPGLVAPTIATVLAVPASKRPLTDALADHLATRRLLLVLDNVEHVLPAAQLIGRLLDTAPELTVLATSRSPLHLAGEQELPLEPMPAPAPEASPDELPGLEAIDLFIDRARAVAPELALTPDTIAAVTEMVARLDGLPLAIELAASRLRSLPLTELVRRLELPLVALGAGPVDVSARQRTLRDAIAWSHGLLDASEQAALRRLAVFRGGFTLDAAEAVAAGEPVAEVGDAVARLVDASLLARPVEAGPARFSMLETIRGYGLERLAGSGEQAEVARRHAGFFAGLVEQAEPELTGPDHVRWLDRLAAEEPNLRAVMSWARDGGDLDLGLVVAGRLWRFWQLRGRLPEGRHWLEQLLVADGEASKAARAKAHLGLAWVCYWLADLDTAEERYTAALDVLADSDDPLLRAEALLGLVVTLACHRDRVEEAKPFEAQLQALSAAAPLPPLLLLALVAAGTIRRFSGDLEGARTYAEQSVELTRRGGVRWWEGEALRALGQISFQQGRLDEAAEHLRASIRIAHELGHHTGVAIDLAWLGRVAVAQGRPAEGVVLAGAASRVREAVGGAFTVQDYSSHVDDPKHAARNLLTTSDVELAWARGRRMTLEEAIAASGAPPADAATTEHDHLHLRETRSVP